MLRQWGSRGYAPGQFLCPHDITMRGDEVLVVDYARHDIQVFRLDGTWVRVCGSHGQNNDQFDQPTAIAATRWGHVLVCDQHNYRVQLLE